MLWLLNSDSCTLFPRKIKLPVKASIVAAELCCLPLCAATVMVYSVPGSRPVSVVVLMSLGTVSSVVTPMEEV